MPTVSITMLNTMADRDFPTALDRHVQWGLHYLDLKDAIFGRGIVELTDSEAHRAASLIRERGLSVYCLSTTLFHDDVESGEEEFRRNNLEPLDRAIAFARVLQPDLIRLLSARTTKRDNLANSTEYLRTEHPWLIELYREAIEKITAAGFRATIENECHANIFSNPNEILDFFGSLNCGDAASLTWDVQNLWQMGTFPSLDVYQQLKPLITYYHLKGGQSEEGSTTLRWKSCLEDASWPVWEITERVITDGVSPVICLNPSHGAAKKGYDGRSEVERDLAFVRNEFL